MRSLCPLVTCAPRISSNTLQHTATHYKVVQQSATHCNTHSNTQQHTAAQCSTVQHSAAQSKTEQDIPAAYLQGLSRLSESSAPSGAADWRKHSLVPPLSILSIYQYWCVCVYMYVCMHVCVCVCCTCPCVYVCMYVWSELVSCALALAWLETAFASPNSVWFTCIWMYVCVCVFVCMCVCFLCAHRLRFEWRFASTIHLW